MDIPIQFPHPADVIAEEVEREQQLTPEQRLDRLGRLYVIGQSLAQSDQNSEGRRKAKELLEAEWQRRQREVFERHGR